MSRNGFVQNRYRMPQCWLINLALPIHFGVFCLFLHKNKILQH